jgi:hypothetical protein
MMRFGQGADCESSSGQRSTFATFSSGDYLSEYYSELSGENDALLRFFAHAAEHVPPGSTLLEFGGGPTIYQLISFATRARRIHFTDHLRHNVDAVRRWIDRHPSAHDWSRFVHTALQHEGRRRPTDGEVDDRLRLLRHVITEFGHVDAFDDTATRRDHRRYDVVSANFVAESISATPDQWHRALANIAARVSGHGLLSITALRDARWWISGSARYPAVSIRAHHLIAATEALGFSTLLVDEVDADPPTDDQPHHGYDGMIFLLARRNAGPAVAAV